MYNRYARARNVRNPMPHSPLYVCAPREVAGLLPDFLGVSGKAGQWEKWEGSVGKGRRVSGKGGKSQWEKKKGPVGKRCLTPDRVRASAEPNILSE